MSATDRGHVAEASPTVTIIWKPGLKEEAIKELNDLKKNKSGKGAKSAPCEDRTHDLQIMRLTRCLLR